MGIILLTDLTSFNNLAYSFYSSFSPEKTFIGKYFQFPNGKLDVEF